MRLFRRLLMRSNDPPASCAADGGSRIEFEAKLRESRARREELRKQTLAAIERLDELSRRGSATR